MRFKPRHLTEAWLGLLTQLRLEGDLSIDESGTLARYLAQKGKLAVNTIFDAFNEDPHIAHVWALYLIGIQDKSCAHKIAEKFDQWLCSRQDPGLSLVAGIADCIIHLAIPVAEKFRILWDFEYKHPEFMGCAIAEPLAELIDNREAEYWRLIDDIKAALNQDPFAPADHTCTTKAMVAIHILSHMNGPLPEEAIPLLKRSSVEHANWSARYFALFSLFNKGHVDSAFVLERLQTEPEFAARLWIASRLAEETDPPMDPLLYVPPILEMMPGVSSETLLKNATDQLTDPRNLEALACTIQNKENDVRVRQTAVELLYGLCLALGINRRSADAVPFFQGLAKHTRTFLDALAWSEGETSRQLITLITEGGGSLAA